MSQAHDGAPSSDERSALQPSDPAPRQPPSVPRSPSRPCDPTFIRERSPNPGAPSTLNPMNTSPIEYEYQDADGTLLAPLHFRARDPITSFGAYEILGEIARGGMGVVYRARHRTLNRTVALKMLLEGEGASEAAIKRFQLEASAAARLQHPNIVQIYEVGEQDGIHFFAMEYVEGRTFLDMIEKEKVKAADAVEVVHKIALALAYAHDHKIIHRDIKPQNILIDRQGVPKLSDFGLAKDFSRATMLTASGVALGTPMYMSPEQAMGQAQVIDHRSDIYSLGAVLYHALTGHPPFEGDSPLSIMNKVVIEEPRGVAQLSREVNRDLETICLKAMAKAPAHRYPGAGDLAEDLERYRNGMQIRARRPSLPERLFRLIRKHRRVSATLLAGALVFGVVVAGLLNELGSQREAQKVIDKARAESGEIPPQEFPEDREYACAEEAHEKLKQLLEQLAKACDLARRWPDAHRAHAELLLRAGRPQEALAAIEELLRLVPGEPGAIYLRARALLEGQGTDPAEARAALNSLASMQPGSRLSDFARARLAILDADQEKAFGILENLTDMERADAAERNRLMADAYALPGRRISPEKAIDALDAALKNGGGSYRDYRKVALWCANARKTEQSRLAFLQAMTMTDAPELVLLDRGKMFTEQILHEDTEHAEARALNYRNAERDFDYAVRKMPDQPYPLLVLADYWTRRTEVADHLTRAEDCYERAHRLNLRDSSTALKLLEFRVQCRPERDNAGFYRELRDQGVLADDVALGSRELLDHLTGALLDLGLSEDAGRLVDRGLEKFPKEYLLHSEKGQIHLKRKEIAEAIRSFDRAIELCTPPSYKLYVWRSRAYAERKDYARAAEDLSEAIKLDPGIRDLYLKRGSRYLQMLNIDKGLADIEQVTLMSTLQEVDEIRSDLVTKGPTKWFEKVDGGIRKFATTFLPMLSQRLSQRGRDRLAAEDVTAAKDAFDRAKIVDPNDWQPHYGLALLHARNRNWDDAAIRLTEAIDHGFRKFDDLDRDPGFDALRRHREYDRVRDKIKSTPK